MSAKRSRALHLFVGMKVALIQMRTARSEDSRAFLFGRVTLMAPGEGNEMAETHEGGCLCGTVRYQAEGNPDLALTGVCHCKLCQRRTGSAFGISVYFADSAIRLTQGALKTYEYPSDESHRWVKTEFCPNCGTTVTWTAEAAPGIRGVAGGTFDDPNWFPLRIHAWTRSAQHWVVFPPGVDIQEKDDTM